MDIKNKLNAASAALNDNASVDNLREMTSQLLFAVSFLENPKSATAFASNRADTDSAFEGLKNLRL